VETILLQPWTTVTSSLPTFTQDESGWLDLACHSDVAGLWIDVAQTLGSIQLALQGSPSHDEAYFVPLTGRLPLTAASGSTFAKPVRTPATPLARFARWQLSGTPGGLGFWTTTFRIYAVVAKQPVWVPTDLAGCTLWLRADLGLQFNGTSISGWNDQSGLGNNLAQGTAANQPGWTATGGPPNNLGPCLTFASSGPQFLLGSGGTNVPASATSCTIFSVAQWTVLGTNSRVLYKLGTGSTGFNLATDSNSNRNIIVDGVSGEPDGVATAAQWEAWTVTGSAAPLQTLRFNGTAETLSPNNSSPFTVSGGHSVGAYTSAGTASSAMDGRCSEIIVYNRVLSATEITRVEGYIRGRTALW
jgi:hypothetical protein